MTRRAELVTGPRRRELRATRATFLAHRGTRWHTGARRGECPGTSLRARELGGYCRGVPYARARAFGPTPSPRRAPRTRAGRCVYTTRMRHQEPPSPGPRMLEQRRRAGERPRAVTGDHSAAPERLRAPPSASVTSCTRRHHRRGPGRRPVTRTGEPPRRRARRHWPREAFPRARGRRAERTPARASALYAPRPGMPHRAPRHPPPSPARGPRAGARHAARGRCSRWRLSLIHISEPTRPY